MKKLLVLFLITAVMLIGCGKEKAPIVAETPQAPSAGQSAGAAQEVIPIGDEKCMDSDGGKNYAVKGKVYGKNEYGVNYEREDVCNKDYVNEYFCSEIGRPQTDVHKCDNTCKDGACV